MANYIAIVHKEAKSDFGVSFPDFPGCITAGKNIDECDGVKCFSLYNTEHCNSSKCQVRRAMDQDNIFSDDTVEKIKEQIEAYKQNLIEKEEDNISPFKILTQKYAGILSKEKMIEMFIEEMKQDISKNISCSDSKSDASMSSNSSDKRFKDLMQDSQDPEDDIPDELVNKALENLKKSFKDNSE